MLADAPAHVAQGKVEHLAHIAAILDRQTAVHEGFADRQSRIGGDLSRQGGVMQTDGDPRLGPVTVGRRCAVGADDRQCAGPDDCIEDFLAE